MHFVIVGGYGARLLGSGMPTKDIDVCPQDSIENFTKLIGAMKELNARYKNAPEGVDIPFDPWLFRNIQIANWVTDYGDLDVINGIPSEDKTVLVKFDELMSRAKEFQDDKLTIFVASLEDIIISKRSANREKDHKSLPALEAMLAAQNKFIPEPPQIE